jgi:hypothetical protein
MLSDGPQLASPHSSRTGDRGAPSGATTFSGTTGGKVIETLLDLRTLRCTDATRVEGDNRPMDRASLS